jgi:hypothetical protein
MNSKPTTVGVSSEKNKSKKNYPIPISNGIFEHYPRLKDARWLLDLFVDWTTRELPNADGSRDGIVLGGKPIRDEEVARAFQFKISIRTARRWRDRLARSGYIKQNRTPIGYVIRVVKSKKWSRDIESGNGQKWPDRTAKNGRSEVQVVASQTGHDRQFRTTDRGQSNKDIAVQDKDEAVEAATSAAAFLLEQRSRSEWKELKLSPIGSLEFRKTWSGIYGTRLAGEKLSEVMERCILACGASKITVPRPFYESKRFVEQCEKNELTSLAAQKNDTEGDRFPRIVNER